MNLIRISEWETEKKQKRGRTAHQVGLFLMATFNEYCLRLLIFVG